MTTIDRNELVPLQVLQSLSTYKLNPDQAADTALDLLTGLPSYASHHPIPFTPFQGTLVR